MTSVYFSPCLYTNLLIKLLPSVFSEPIIGGFFGLPIIVPLGPALNMEPPPWWDFMKRRFNFNLNFLSSLYFLFNLIIELLTFSNPIFCLLRVLRFRVLFLLSESVFPRNKCLLPPILCIPPEIIPKDDYYLNLFPIEPPPSFIEAPRFELDF